MMHVKTDNTIIFREQARKLQEIKVFLNKDFIRGLDIKNKCREIAQQFFNEDLADLEEEFLNDEKYRRKYIIDTLNNKKITKLFLTDSSDVVIDQEHMLLLYYKLLSIGSSLTKRATGLLYYIAGEQLQEEFEGLIKASTYNYLAPVFDLSPKTFRWKRCNQILRKYSLYFTKSPGYNAYYFEKPDLAQIAYLMFKGKTFKEAEQHIKKSTDGVFYSFLKKDVENRLANAIFSGRLTKPDGVYASELAKDKEKLGNNYDEEIYSVYTEFIKPIMIEHNGMQMSKVLKEFEKQGITSTDAYIYHVSPYRFGILIKDSMDIKEVLPKTWKQLKPVEEPKLRDLIFGYYL